MQGILNARGDAAVLLNALAARPSFAMHGEARCLVLEDGSRSPLGIDLEVERAAASNGKMLVIEASGDRVLRETWVSVRSASAR